MQCFSTSLITSVNLLLPMFPESIPYVFPAPVAIFPVFLLMFSVLNDMWSHVLLGILRL